MASLVLSGDSSGSITVSAPAVAGSTTQTLVAVTDTLAPVVRGTVVTTTGGTSIDFTSIPSWVKRITVIFNSVSVSSTTPARVQIGAGSVDATGYLCASSTFGASVVATANFTDGFAIRGLTGTDVFSGSVVLTNISGNIWIANGVLGNNSATGMAITAGTKTLSGTLDRVRITINGTDTFDANGGINLLWE